MRQYKKLIIPDREPRTSDDIDTKQMNYCNKSNCDYECKTCLFGIDNTKVFKEWYLNKNKPKKNHD
jgi:hypothetical protein